MNPLSNGITPILSRFGREAVIQRRSESGTDRLNHSTGSYESVGTEYCVLYNPESEGGQTSSGELSLNSNKFAFKSGADIRLNDRVVYDSTVYEIEQVATRPNFIVAEAKEVL